MTSAETPPVGAIGPVIDVSVIVCVRNGAPTLRRQLDALDRQEDHPPFEVLVVDNGSSDATRDVVTSWIAEPDHAARAVRLIDGPSRPGIPRTRNMGALRAVGRVLAFCDADDEVDARWVGAMAREVDGDQLAGGRILARTAGGTERPDVFGPGLLATRYLPHVGNCNCAVSRQTYMTVGGYDESLPRYGFEDVDFSWRVQEAGFPLVYAPDAAVHFTISDARTSVKKRFALGVGRVLMAWRYPGYDPVRYTVARTLRDLGAEAGRIMRDGLRSKSLPRARLGQMVALTGRVWGAVRYRSGRRLPERKLLARPVADGRP